MWIYLYFLKVEIDPRPKLGILSNIHTKPNPWWYPSYKYECPTLLSSYNCLLLQVACSSIFVLDVKYGSLLDLSSVFMFFVLFCTCFVSYDDQPITFVLQRRIHDESLWRPELKWTEFFYYLSICFQLVGNLDFRTFVIYAWWKFFFSTYVWAFSVYVCFLKLVIKDL